MLGQVTLSQGEKKEKKAARKIRSLLQISDINYSFVLLCQEHCSTFTPLALIILVLRSKHHTK